MNGSRTHWVIAGMAAIIGAMATLLVVEGLRKGESSIAYAQTGEAAGSANYVLALLGSTTADATPIVLIDTKTQTLLVYEFMVSKHAMYLRAARKYVDDRELRDNNFYTGGDLYSGPSVNDIQKLINPNSRR
jgi:hypothetical protein